MSAITSGVHHIGLTVKDLSRTKEFFIDNTELSLKGQHEEFSQGLENVLTIVSDTKEAMEKDQWMYEKQHRTRLVSFKTAVKKYR